MKVKDLIEQLERMDPDAPVVLDHPDYVGSKYFEITIANSDEGKPVEDKPYWRNPDDCYRRNGDDLVTEELVVLS